MTSIDFAAASVAVENWIAVHNPDVNLILADDVERRFHFMWCNCSFYIECPSSGKKKWHVWSDDDSVLCHLNSVQGLIASCSDKSVADVMAATCKCIRPIIIGAASAQDSDEAFEDADLDNESNDDDDDDQYYQYSDEDNCENKAMPPEPTVNQQNKSEPSTDDFFIGDGSHLAAQRILTDLKQLKKSEGKYGVEGQPRDDNLFIWDVRLTNFEKDSRLGKDLLSYASQYSKEPVISMEMKFPKDYPMSPPFVRIIQPRLQFMTGHVTVGGSICMELLTSSGWRPTNDIESILIQVRSVIMSDEKARLCPNNPTLPYDEASARSSFDRMAMKYGWK